MSVKFQVNRYKWIPAKSLQDLTNIPHWMTVLDVWLFGPIPEELRLTLLFSWKGCLTRCISQFSESKQIWVKSSSLIKVRSIIVR
jgi:hypothetical protein